MHSCRRRWRSRWRCRCPPGGRRTGTRTGSASDRSRRRWRSSSHSVATGSAGSRWVMGCNGRYHSWWLGAQGGWSRAREGKSREILTDHCNICSRRAREGARRSPGQWASDPFPLLNIKSSRPSKVLVVTLIKLLASSPSLFGYRLHFSWRMAPLRSIAGDLWLYPQVLSHTAHLCSF